VHDVSTCLLLIPESGRRQASRTRFGAADTSRCKLHAPRFLLFPSLFNFLRSSTFIIPYCFSLHLLFGFHSFFLLLPIVTGSLHVQSAPCIHCIPGDWLPAEISISCIPPILLVDRVESLHNEFALGKSLYSTTLTAIVFLFHLLRSTGTLEALERTHLVPTNTRPPALEEDCSLVLMP
jgi:hypothetical protein